MVVSETLNRVKTHTLQACVLLCTMAVLPCSMAYAQDYEAVGKRLRAAVEAGELTGEQARAMLGALRKTAEREGERNPAVNDERVAKYRGIAARIKAAVEAGKLSEEDSPYGLPKVRTAYRVKTKKVAKKVAKKVKKAAKKVKKAVRLI